MRNQISFNARDGNSACNKRAKVHLEHVFAWTHHYIYDITPILYLRGLSSSSKATHDWVSHVIASMLISRIETELV